MAPRSSYRSFDDFAREEIHSGLRPNWSIDDVEDPNRQEIDFDHDPFEAMLDSAEYEEDDDDDE